MKRFVLMTLVALVAATVWAQRSADQLDTISGTVWDTASDSQKNPVGKRCEFGDGRVFRYARACTTVSNGCLVSMSNNTAAIAATYFGATASVGPIVGEGGAAGDTVVRLSDDVTGLTADEFRGGYLAITTQSNRQYVAVRGNDATGTGGTGFKLYLDEPLKAALDQGSTGTLYPNKYSMVRLADAANFGGDPNEMVVGIPCVNATNLQYCWVQTWGPCMAKADGTTVVKAGATLQCAEVDDGSVQDPIAGENLVQEIGIGMLDMAVTVWGLIDLRINH